MAKSLKTFLQVEVQPPESVGARVREGIRLATDFWPR
jgi:hypothetical protein